MPAYIVTGAMMMPAGAPDVFAAAAVMTPATGPTGVLATAPAAMSAASGVLATTAATALLGGEFIHPALTAVRGGRGGRARLHRRSADHQGEGSDRNISEQITHVHVPVFCLSLVARVPQTLKDGGAIPRRGQYSQPTPVNRSGPHQPPDIVTQ
jgi:hypothetical protein